MVYVRERGPERGVSYLRISTHVSSRSNITVRKETLVAGKFGELSAKVPLAKIKFGELLYGARLMQLSSGVM